MTEIDSTELIRYARTWLDTPWQHNQCCRGVGVDCIRFAVDCYAHMGLYTGEIYHYQRQPRDNSLKNYLATLPTLREQPSASEVKAGQLLLFRVGGVPHHVGIATSDTTFIHADSRPHHMRVIEQPFLKWKKRIVSKFNAYSE